MNFSGFTGFARQAGVGIAANPVAFAAAALAAPFVVNNDERGYVRSAMLTTPLVAAGFAAFQNPADIAMGAMQGWKRFQQQWDVMQSVRGDGFAGLNRAVFAGTDLSSMSGLRDFLDTAAIKDLAVEAKPWDQAAALKDALGSFETLLGDPSRRSLLTHAVEQSRLASLSPGEVLQDTGASVAVLANKPSEDLRNIVAQYQGRPDFVRSLQYKLNQALRLNDKADLDLSMLAAKSTPQWMEMTDALDLLDEQRPALAEALRRRHMDLSRVRAMTSPEGGQLRRVIGLEISRGEKDVLSIPVFDPVTHQVMMGSDFSQPGIGRFLYNDRAAFDPDVFLVNHLDHPDWSKLREDLGTAFYYGSVDPTNPYKVAARAESAGAELPAHAALMRGQAAVPTSLEEFGGVAFGSRDFGFAARAELTKKMMTAGLPYNGDGRNIVFGAYGSEGATSHGVMGIDTLRFHSVGADPDMQKQTPAFRSFSKELTLDHVETSLKPRVAAEALADMNELRATAGGISPRVKSLLGDLAAGIQSTEKAAAVIAGETGLPIEVARTRAADLVKKFNRQQALAMARAAGAPEEELLLMEQESMRLQRAAAKVGSLGEGGHLLHPKFASHSLSKHASFTLNTVKYGEGAEFGPNDVLGIAERNHVISSAPRNVVERIERLEDGRFRVGVKQYYPFETGTKGEIMGVKGLFTVADSDAQFDLVRNLLNDSFGATLASDVDVLSPAHYAQAKAQDLFHLMLEQGVDTAARLPENDSAAAEYRAALEANHIHAGDGRYLDVMGSVPGLDRSQMAAQIERRNADLVTATENFFKTVGERARANHVGYQGELFDMFRRSRMQDFAEFRHRNALATSVRAWGTTHMNLPAETSVTYDLIGEMWRMGHTEGIKDLYSRMQHPAGDPAMSREFLEHITGPGKHGALGAVRPLSDLTYGEGLQDRGGTIFDPTHPDLQKNFSIDLGESYRVRAGTHEFETRYLPVLGKEAYGGAGDKYKPGTFRANEYEQALANVQKAVGDKDRMTKALSSYYEVAATELVGKDGIFRAKGVDPMGGAAFLHTRAHPENPFTVSISKGHLNRLQDIDPEAYKTIKAGGEQYATIARHPISSAPYVRVVLDSTLGKNELGFDERLRSPLNADDDMDTIFYMFHHGEAAKEARAEYSAANQATSAQWRRLRKTEALYGSLEDSRNISKSMVDQLFTGEKGFFNRVRAAMGANRVEQVTNRMAGSTIGMYSNLLTRMDLNLQAHPTLSLNAEAMESLQLAFWQIRQTPISAQKTGQMADNPLALYHKLNDALKSPGLVDPDRVVAAFDEMAGVAGKKGLVSEDTFSLFPQLRGRLQAGQEANVLQELMRTDSMRGWLKDFAAGRNPAADHLAELVTKKAMRYDDAVRAIRSIGHSGPALQAALKTPAGSAHGAAMLGGLNQAWKEMKAGASAAFKPMKPALAMGLGIAAVAGLMTTTVTNDDSIRAAAPPPPARRPRPGAAGAETDAVPDEPIAGSEAPSNPKRQVVQSPEGVRTAVVAPVNRARRLEVKAAAPNRDSLREMERLVESSGARGGNVSVTKNYSGGWRERASRLRLREQIKEQLDQ